MFNTLYSIAGGIALAVGALGASDDFDGAQLAQNAFFSPEDAVEAVEEQEMATEEVVVVKDVFEWVEIASKAMGMSLTGSDELTDDEKLEISVLNEEIPTEDAEKPAELLQIAENTQSEGLSEEEFYSMLEHQFNDAMAALDSEEVVADSEPLVIEAVAEDKSTEEIAQDAKEEVLFDQSDELAVGTELQPEDDVNAEKALEEVLENSVKEEPWAVVHGLPDIPEKDMDILMNQTTKNEQPIETEQTDIGNVEVQEIPIIESTLIDVPDVDAPELEDIEVPLFDEADDAEEANVEEVEETEAEEAEDENADAEEETEADEALIVEPLEDDAAEVETNSEALTIPSLEIPPAVLSEEQRAKISEEVDAIANQNDNFDSWIPRQIPVSGSVDDAQPQTKPEDDFIQNFSRQNVKESVLENNGIDLK